VRVFLMVAVLAGAPGLLHGIQQPEPGGPPVRAEPADSPSAAGAGRFARVPYGPGERAVFQARVRGISVGSGSLEVHGMETVDGRQTYRTEMKVSGGMGFARVNNRMESWIDAIGLFSRRFHQDTHEVRFKRIRTFNFFPERRELHWVQRGETHPLPTGEPLDDLSFLFYARTLPLRVGETYTLNRYWKEDGNPVILKVLRRETVTVPAGTFATVVVQPLVRTDGLFGQGGEAEVYFTDDEHRIPVLLRSRVPVLGSLTLQLREYEAGDPITPRR
jgi:hypothetical protein